MRFFENGCAASRLPLPGDVRRSGFNCKLSSPRNSRLVSIFLPGQDAKAKDKE